MGDVICHVRLGLGSEEVPLQPLCYHRAVKIAWSREGGFIFSFKMWERPLRFGFHAYSLLLLVKN